MKRNKRAILIISIGIILPSIISGASSKIPHFLNSDAAWSLKTLQSMTLRQKIGQLFIATVAQESVLSIFGSMKSPQNSPEYIQDLIEKYEVGGILFLGRNVIEDQIRLTNKYQCMSKLPLLVLEDLEWGLQMRLNDAIRFPRNIALGAIQNESLIGDLGYEIGKQCKAIGVHINLAPVIDINNNAANPVIGTRSFSENPARVARLGTLLMQGMQKAGILACAKHFPGHGDTHQDSHLTLPIIEHSRARLESVELVPFQKLIDAGVDAIMPGHLKIPALDPSAISTVSYPIMTTLLKDIMGFNGLKITDALNMRALEDSVPGEIELQAFLAGNDLFLCSLDIPKAINSIESAVRAGIISEKELDLCVLKILRAKEYVGLSKNRCVTLSDKTQINTPDALDLKKKLYENAITLIKNSNHLLPLKKAERNLSVIQIGGDKDSIFSQSLAEQKIGKIHYTPSKMTRSEAQKVIKNCAHTSTVIIGLFDIEKSARVKNFGINEETIHLIKDLKKTKKKVILLVFGNPYSLSLFGIEDTIIMAYEDDADAQEAAIKVVVGKLKPQGKLPITASKQFKYGLGLTW